MRPRLPSATLPTVARLAGFGLIEILVSMVIGLVTFLVIAQVFAGFESSKRTTMFGVDAQVNGLLALRMLEKEIRQGGYGLTGNAAMMCPVVKNYYGGATPIFSVLPIRINDAGGTTPDTIDTFYSSSAQGAAPLHITAATPAQTSVKTVVAGLAQCDFVLLAAPDGSKQCSLLQVTTATANTKVFDTDPASSNYNPPAAAQATYFPVAYDNTDVVINMGQFVTRRLQVAQTGVTDEYFLRQTNVPAPHPDLSANPSGCVGAPAPTPDIDLVSNVVDIQARYGVAEAGSQEVTCWTDAVNLPAAANPAMHVTGLNTSYCYGKNWTSASLNDTSTPAAINAATTLKNRIKAVRVAVAVRSALPEQPAVPGGACDTTTVLPVGWGGGPTMSGVEAVTNWQCYRYKVYQTITPVINAIWANS